jgi:hypothetical protein
MFRQPGRWFAFALVFGLLSSSGWPAVGLPAEASSTWAVIIAVQTHDNPRFNLDFTTNDAAKLKEILVQRGGVLLDHILMLMDDSPAKLQPRLENLQRELPKFLNQAQAGDRLIVFFSGHGVPHGEQICLVPKNFDPGKPAETGLSASELRSLLSACAARVKLLILDCCHAGGARDMDSPSLPAETLAKSITRERVDGCIVLASCRSDEKSREWPERKHGVFTYWLCRALEGGADTDGNGTVTADEVYQYTQERVTTTVDRVFGAAQHPVRLQAGEVEGVPDVLALVPEPPETLCRRLAEHLDIEIRHRKLQRIGVLEFLQPLGRTEGLAASNLPAYCADHVRRALDELAGGAYTVLDEAKMREAAKGVRLEAVGEPEQMQPLRQRAGGLDAAVIGSLRKRGPKLHVQCELVDAATGNSLVAPTSVLPLSEDLVGDAGVSFDNRERPSGGPYETQVVSFVQSRQDHPFLLLDKLETPDVDESFPFRLEVWSIEAQPGEKITVATPRKKKEFVQLPPTPDDPQRRTTELLIPAREDELFEIRVWSKFPDKVAMMLTIDGLNTLNKQRQRLGFGAAWIIKPAHDWKGEPSLTVDAWHDLGQQVKPGERITTTARRFMFVDIADSVAGRQRFSDAIGLITAAFYQEAGRDVAVGEGLAEQRQINVVDFRPGRLIGVVSVRYVDERDLQRILDGR